MEDDRFGHIGPFLKAVCDEAVAIVGTDVDDIFLYSEVEDGSVFGAIFRMGEAIIEYHSPTPELFKRLQEAWLAEEPDQRWFVMQCEIYDGTFAAGFEYLDDFIRNEPATERCCREMTFRCGDDQQLLYPPLAAHKERHRLVRRRNPTVKERISNTGFMMGIVLGEAARLAGGTPNNMFIHAIMGDRWSSIDIYRNEKDLVRHHLPGPDFIDLIHRFWALDDANHRWSVMEMGVSNGQFDAFFLHPGEVDVEKRDIDWRKIALQRRYGDKTIFYPPPDWITKFDQGSPGR